MKNNILINNLPESLACHLFPSRRIDCKYFFLKMLLAVIFFLYVFSVRFVNFPMGSRTLLSFLGVFLLIATNFKKSTHASLNISRRYIVAFCAFSMVLIASTLPVLYNGVFDDYLFKILVSDLLCFTAFYVIALLMNYIYGEVSFAIIANYFVLVVLIQAALSLTMFFLPSLRDFLLSAIVNSKVAEDKIILAEGVRLVGFGANFFGAGIINSFSLILIACLARVKQISFAKFFMYVFSYFVVFCVGMMVSRTTIVGFVLSCPIFICSPKPIIVAQRIFRFWGSVLIMVSCIAIATGTLSDEKLEQLNKIARFGFEMVERYYLYGEVSTGSTNSMLNMYRFPTEEKTWLLGDGFFLDPTNPEMSYYMKTDIGFIRLIFYSGLTGLVVFSILQAILVFQAYKACAPHFKLFFLLVFVMYSVVMLKGFTTLAALIVPFYFVRSSCKEI